MEKRVSVNIYKKGNVRIDYMLFEVKPMRRVSIERIEILNTSDFIDKFSTLLEEFKKNGIEQEQFKWTAPLERYDKTSEASKAIAQAAKELVVKMGFRKPADKLDRKKKFVKGRVVKNGIKKYFVERGLIVKGDPSGVSLAKQRELWEIGLGSTRKWKSNFSKEIKKFEG